MSFIYSNTIFPDNFLDGTCSQNNGYMRQNIETSICLDYANNKLIELVNDYIVKICE